MTFGLSIYRPEFRCHTGGVEHGVCSFNTGHYTQQRGRLDLHDNVSCELRASVRLLHHLVHRFYGS